MACRHPNVEITRKLQCLAADIIKFCLVPHCANFVAAILDLGRTNALRIDTITCQPAFADFVILRIRRHTLHFKANK
ncbi:hypothetical protein D9M71_603960 [compost metagenome]